MLNSIKQFFSSQLEKKPGADRNAQLQLAVAALLLEVLSADKKSTQVEQQKITTLLKQRFQISDEHLIELISLAETEVQEANDLFQFTKLINENFSYTEKVQLIQYLWEVAYADNNLDKYEEYLIRKICDLIYVSHADFIKTKLTSLKTQ